ncbi:MAG: hypothetical protein EB127_18800, partial [Alphaproteobacteria bacterium]|nr:hypothetical protein [Alphaproteobacteria bacterium]
TLVETYLVQSQNLLTIIPTKDTTHQAFSSATTKYARAIDANWRPVQDAGNPITIANVSPQKTIPVKGTISGANITEIERSISYAICLNFTDTSRIESQIRISSDDLQLYMSPDASGRPEFKNTIDPVLKTSTITPLHAEYNSLHSGILVTPAIFYCLPFHTRNIINHWATVRHARVLQWKNGQGSTVNLVGTGALGSTPTTPAWNQGNNPAAPTSTQGANSATYISGTSTNAPIKGSLFNTSITPAVRNALFDSMAQFYYTNERTDLGSDGGNNAQGYATMNKIVDIFQIGDTIFDVRFEEYRKRGLLFQRKLQEIDAEYNSYKQMNLSKEDQISLEEKYLNKKTALYTADDNYVWGQTQACGVKAQYVVINSSTNLFNISQIIIINSAGQNVALSSTVYSSSQTGDTTNSNIIYNTSPENLDYSEKLL